MLASRWDEPFADPDWVFELKWDGIRALVSSDEDGVRVWSRVGNDLTSRYPELRSWRPSEPAVIDGEIVAFDDQGRPSFEVLQRRMSVLEPSRVRPVPVALAAFDVLYHGEELIAHPWEARRAVLDAIDLPEPFFRSEVAPGDGHDLWSLVRDRDLEGIVAKRLGSPYHPGQRTADWRKIARFRYVRAVVGGYLPGEGARANSLASLLLGLWTPDGLRWVGAVGSGFSAAQLAAIRDSLDRMTVEVCPFVADPGLPREAVWVVPQLVALVRYKEFTSAGRLRGPSFQGFTDDDPGEITWEAEGPPAG